MTYNDILSNSTNFSYYQTIYCEDIDPQAYIFLSLIYLMNWVIFY